jgi:hypothetical protein
MILLTS